MRASMRLSLEEPIKDLRRRSRGGWMQRITLVVPFMLLASLRVTAASISDLPLIEVRPEHASDRLAVFFSGDGGWTSIDQRVSARLAVAGVPVVGVNSLRYFWRKRSPEEAA